MPAFRVSEDPFVFPNARDAIDAVSLFEAGTLDDWDYAIQAYRDRDGGIDYIVKVARVSGSPLRGYLTT